MFRDRVNVRDSRPRQVYALAERSSAVGTRGYIPWRKAPTLGTPRKRDALFWCRRDVWRVDQDGGPTSRRGKESSKPFARMTNRFANRGATLRHKGGPAEIAPPVSPDHAKTIAASGTPRQKVCYIGQGSHPALMQLKAASFV
jgi:hypothetical protein